MCDDRNIKKYSPLTLRWMKEMAKNDPEIRVLSDFLEGIRYERSGFFGYHRWREVLFEIDASIRLFSLLEETYRKWFWRRSCNRKEIIYGKEGKTRSTFSVD